MSGQTAANNARRKPAGSNPSPVSAHATRTIEQLLNANLELTRQVVELARLVIESRESDVREQVQIVAPPAWSTEPLYESEEIEDAKYQFRHGQIDKEQLESMLAQAGYQNTEIDLTL